MKAALTMEMTHDVIARDDVFAECAEECSDVPSPVGYYADQHLATCILRPRFPQYPRLGAIVGAQQKVAAGAVGGTTAEFVYRPKFASAAKSWQAKPFLLNKHCQ